jgi:hypothetical protein
MTYNFLNYMTVISSFYIHNLKKQNHTSVMSFLCLKYFISMCVCVCVCMCVHTHTHTHKSNLAERSMQINLQCAITDSYFDFLFIDNSNLF